MQEVQITIGDDVYLVHGEVRHRAARYSGAPPTLVRLEKLEVMRAHAVGEPVPKGHHLALVSITWGERVLTLTNASILLEPGLRLIVIQGLPMELPSEAQLREAVLNREPER